MNDVLITEEVDIAKFFDGIFNKSADKIDSMLPSDSNCDPLSTIAWLPDLHNCSHFLERALFTYTIFEEDKKIVRNPYTLIFLS